MHVRAETHIQHSWQHYYNSSDVGTVEISIHLWEDEQKWHGCKASCDLVLERNEALLPRHLGAILTARL